MHNSIYVKSKSKEESKLPLSNTECGHCSSAKIQTGSQHIKCMCLAPNAFLLRVSSMVCVHYLTNSFIIPGQDGLQIDDLAGYT